MKKIKWFWKLQTLILGQNYILDHRNGTELFKSAMKSDIKDIV